MKKRFFLGSMVAVLALPIAIAASVFANKGLLQAQNVKADTYTFTVDSDDFADSDLTTTYQQQVAHEFDGEGSPILNYFLAKLDADDNLVLAPSGRVYNYQGMATYAGRITDILSITVDFETGTGGKLFVQGCVGGNQLVFGDKLALTSGVAMPLPTHPNFFMLSNSHTETTISRISITYSCSASNYSLENLGTVYKGMDENKVTQTLTRNGESVSVAGQSGTIAVTDAGAFTLTLAAGNIVYTGTVSADYRTLNFTGKSGAYASAAPDILEMNRVYVFDDFEDYDFRGTGYATSKTSVFTASDLKAAYYSDYQGGGSGAWVNTSGFQVCTSDDFINLGTAANGVHSGSKSALLKTINGKWMRFWSSDVFNTNQHFSFGSGDVFSLYARGAYTSTACTTAFANDVTLKIVVYYSNNFVIDNNNRSSATYSTTDFQFTIKANSGWTEYKVALDSSKQVYAVNLMVLNSNGTAYVPVDDLSIYTQGGPRKYQESATRITKTYNGVVNLQGGFQYTVKIALGANGYTYGWAGDNMQPTGYTITGNTIAITTEGFVHVNLLNKDLYFGNWSGTLSNNNKTITIPKANITGDIADYITDSEVVLNEDANVLTGAEGNSTLQAYLTRQYGGSWDTDSGNGDRVAQNANYFMEGNNAIRIRPYKDARYSVIVNKTLAENTIKKISSIAFWFYVPADMTVQVFGYDGYDPLTAAHYQELFSRKYDGTAGKEYGWHYVNLGTTYNEVDYDKNVRIAVTSGYSNALIIDYVTFF